MGTLTIKSSCRHGEIKEDLAMPAIVEYPTIVKEALDKFGPFFANEPERRHFAEYLTGLFIAQRKNVSAINREFAKRTDQSCLNRWLKKRCSLAFSEERKHQLALPAFLRLPWESFVVRTAIVGTCRTRGESSPRYEPREWSVNLTCR